MYDIAKTQDMLSPFWGRPKRTITRGYDVFWCDGDDDEDDDDDDDDDEDTSSRVQERKGRRKRRVNRTTTTTTTDATIVFYRPRVGTITPRYYTLCVLTTTATR